MNLHGCRSRYERLCTPAALIRSDLRPRRSQKEDCVDRIGSRSITSTAAIFAFSLLAYDKGRCWETVSPCVRDLEPNNAGVRQDAHAANDWECLDMGSIGQHDDHTYRHLIVRIYLLCIGSQDNLDYCTSNVRRMSQTMSLVAGEVIVRSYESRQLLQPENTSFCTIHMELQPLGTSALAIWQEQQIAFCSHDLTQFQTWCLCVQSRT